MFQSSALRVAYVVKMYPRFSETFIVNEVLAHEAAGQSIEIFSLRSPADGRFHEDYARVQAPVTYVPHGEPKATRLWDLLRVTGRRFPLVWPLVADEPDLSMADLCQAMHLAPLLVDRGIDVIHAHFASVATSVARLASKLTGIPFVFTAHAKDIYHEEVDDNDLARKLRDAAAVITVSDFNLTHLQSTYGHAAASTVRVFNGLPLAKFPFAAAAHTSRHIVAVGRLVEKKGFDVLVDACAELRARGAEFTCDIAGSGPEETALRAQIERLGLADRVRLVGPLPQSGVIDLVRRGAVFAAPCVVGKDGNRDGLPTVLLEAMAMGTPCVSTDVTGIPELIAHGETGLLAPQGDARGLADALAQLLNDPALGAQLAANGRGRIETDFNVERSTAALRAIYARAADPMGTPVSVSTIATPILEVA
jgi:colanic acid/amylovoran biosynthesis glycosyltransferase